MRSERQEGTLSIPEHEKRHGGQIGQRGSVGIGGFMTQYEGDYDTVWRDLRRSIRGFMTQ